MTTVSNTGLGGSDTQFLLCRVEYCPRLSNASHGTVSILGSGQIQFNPEANYHGPASFVYQVVSTDGNFALGEASFEISGVNDVPVVLGETPAPMKTWRWS